jgi:hypothetical protein
MSRINKSCSCRAPVKEKDMVMVFVESGVKHHNHHITQHTYKNIYFYLYHKFFSHLHGTCMLYLFDFKMHCDIIKTITISFSLTGARQEQDLFIRLIDSVSKQVRDYYLVKCDDYCPSKMMSDRTEVIKLLLWVINLPRSSVINFLANSIKKIVTFYH